MSCSVDSLKTIAEETVRGYRTDGSVAALLPGHSSAANAEVLIVFRGRRGQPTYLLVGVNRDQPESEIRRAFADSLRAAL